MSYINLIANHDKQTRVKLYLKEIPLDFANYLYGNVIFGDWKELEPLLIHHHITDYQIEFLGKNSALNLLDLRKIEARIEPGAIIRDHVTIGKQSVILMGAVINVGASIGSKTMIDMGAIIGSGAQIDENCHIGANAVIAGMMEPYNEKNVHIEKNCLIGANAVILEGITIHQGAVVGAGAVVTKDVPANCVVVGVPAQFIKQVDQKLIPKIKVMESLRE